MHKVYGWHTRLCVYTHLSLTKHAIVCPQYMHQFFLDSPAFFLQQLLQMFAVLVITGVANAYMLIAGVVVTVVLSCLRYYYVPRAVELKRLEAAGGSAYTYSDKWIHTAL